MTESQEINPNSIAKLTKADDTAPHTNLATTLEYVNPEMSQLRVQLSKLGSDLDELQDVE